MATICKQENCQRAVWAKGLCNAHYLRLRKGIPMDSPIARMAKRGLGHVTVKGYRRLKVKGRHIMEHRLIMENYLGRTLIPNVEDVHHVNGNKLDNRLGNLEVILHGKHTTLHLLREPVVKGYKRCLKCGLDQGTKFFTRLKQRQDGEYSYQPYCKKCVNNAHHAL